MRCLPSSIIMILILQGINVIDPSFKQKMKLWWLPKIEGSILKYNVPPFWPTYIGQRWTTFAKVYGIKVRSYYGGEHVGEHIGNLRNILRIWWEPIGNLKGTYWEPKKKWTKNLPPPLPNLKGKKASHLECLPIGCMKFFFPKELVTIFGLG